MLIIMKSSIRKLFLIERTQLRVYVVSCGNDGMMGLMRGGMSFVSLGQKKKIVVFRYRRSKKLG